MAKSRTTIKGHEGQARIKEDFDDTLAADTYWYAVTSVTSGTEDDVDLAKDDSVVLTETGSAMICWDAVSGADNYRIYRTITTPATTSSYDNSCIATIPASQEYPYFIDTGYTAAGQSGSPGAGSNTPTIYGHKERPQTRIPSSLTSFAFEEITFDIDEGYSAHVHGGTRTKTHKEGSAEIKGTIKRKMTGGYFKGACDGWDRAGSTNSNTAYSNIVLGDGTGKYDGTTYTTSNNEQSPIARRKPKFELDISLTPDDSTPMKIAFTDVKIYDWKSGVSADGEVIETMSWAAEGMTTEYDGSQSFS